MNCTYEYIEMCVTVYRQYFTLNLKIQRVFVQNVIEMKVGETTW